MYNRFLFSLRRIGEGQGQTEIAKEAKRNEGRGKEKRSKGQIRRSKSQNGKGKGQSKEGGRSKKKTWISEWKSPQSGKLFLQMKRINVRKTLL